MKKSILFIFSVLSIGSSIGQVGINTQNPQGIFHIDGAKNTSGTSNVIDDLLINTQGDVGIGTVTQANKLDVMGNVIINDGTAAADRILTSDNQGIGTWREFDRSKGIVTWSVNSTTTFPVFTDILINGTQTLSDPEGLGFATFASTTSSAITVPAGTYLIIMDLDVLDKQEYGLASIMIQGTSSYIYRVFYLEALTGGSTIYTFPTATNLELLCKYRNVTAAGDNLTRYSAPPFTRAEVTAKVMFISLIK